MFNTVSVIDGFKVILGSMPLQLGMFFTVIFMVPIPEIDGQWDSKAMFYKFYLVFVHGILFVQIVVNHYFINDFPMLSSCTNVILLSLQVMTQINISVDWIFNEPEQVWLDARQSKDWMKFMNWMQIELLVFIGYLVSATLFNFIISIKRPVADIENPATGS